MSEDVKVTRVHPERVQIMRTWSIEAPDWTPAYRTRAIAPRKISVVWVDGEVSRVAVSGPYRLKSGKLSEDEGGTGDPDYRADWDRMEYYRGWSGDSNRYPAWVPQFIADHTPAEGER
jgi:hypothetical protein